MQSLAGGPNRPLVQLAAKGHNEPKLPKCCKVANVR